MEKEDLMLYEKLRKEHRELTNKQLKNYKDFLKLKDQHKVDHKAERKKEREISKKQKELKNQMNEILKRNDMKQIPQDVYADMRREINKDLEI